jgi:hypothetical protein
MPVVRLYLGDVIRTRKAHPCGGNTWEIERVGADIGIRCRTCGRYVLVARTRLEGRIVAFLERGADRPQTPPPLSVARASKTPAVTRRSRRSPAPASEPEAPRRRIIRRRDPGNDPPPKS